MRDAGVSCPSGAVHYLTAAQLQAIRQELESMWESLAFDQVQASALSLQHGKGRSPLLAPLPHLLFALLRALLELLPRGPRLHPRGVGKSA